ncbi:MAG: RadC family protein [Clostridia bacterium]|nr:RadC family protein [Clostridia bacterium]
MARVHDGHRKRAMAKLAKGELLEHEVLETLLFNAVPRKNTNDLAHRLLAQFGSIPALFKASMNELLKVEGVGESVAAYLVSIGYFLNKYYAPAQNSLPEKFDFHSFLGFVKATYADEKVELLDCYLLDDRGLILYRRRFTANAATHATIAPEDFTDIITEPNVSGIVMVHNHPGGECKPTLSDDLATRKCQMACSFHNVLFCDHMVYGNGGVYSYYLDGRMQQISKECSIENLFVGEEGKNEK